MDKKRYLISGGTGFLGKHIVDSLDSDSFDTIGRSSENRIKYDFTDAYNRELKLLNKYEYLIIASGHAHVLKEGPKDLYFHFSINFGGVTCLLGAVDRFYLKGVVFISTAAVYGTECSKPFNERDDLNGDTAYAKSKIAAENYLIEWSRNFNIPILILRVPLIVGKNPPGNLGQMIKAIRGGLYFSILGGKARRSAVLAEDLADFILRNCGNSGVYNLCDGLHPSFREFEILISKQLNVKCPREMPFLFAKIISWFGDFISFIPINSQRLEKLSKDLIIDDSNARRELSWNPKAVIKNFKI